MNQIRMSNVPSVSAGALVEMITGAVASAIQRKSKLSEFPSVMLWGPPGIGKSEAIREIAAGIEEETGRKTVVTDVRLLLFSPIDLRGIPTVNEDRTLAVWLKPKIFQMEESPDVVNLLLLDELTSAPQSVQAAAYQLTLDRAVGEHKLPDNCLVFAAGNRTTDRSVSYRMPKALANRMMHFDVEAHFDSWKRWAVQKGIHPKVTGFLTFKPDLLMQFDPASPDAAFPTPRSWEMVSRLLFAAGNLDESHLFPMIAGLVGEGAAAEFWSWCRVAGELPDIRKIFLGQEQKVPKRADVLYALVSSMTSYAREHRDDMTQIENSIRYAEKLPPDFSAILLRDYLYLDKNYKEKLLQIPAFADWLQKKGSLMNGFI